MPLRSIILIFLLTGCLLLITVSSAAQYPAAWYRWSPSSDAVTNPPVIGIITGPQETVGGKIYKWWELVYHAPNTSGPRFRCQFLSDQIPMAVNGGVPYRILRYLLAETGLPPVEYINAETGEALLPRFQFLENFIPQPSKNTFQVDGFVPTGRFLGHALTQFGVTRNAEWKPIAAKPLAMNRNLLIGTGRTVKDDGTGMTNGDYTYVPWTAQDYTDMIDAGHNYFQFKEIPYKSFYDQPLFYSGDVNAAEYPEQFYRSSYMGPTQYLDEPTILGQNALKFANIHYPEEGASFTEVYVQSLINQKGTLVQSTLESRGIDVGDMVLVDEDIPSWETIFEASFYQFAGGISGFIHESRFGLAYFNNWFRNYYNVSDTLSRNEMFLFHYSTMRGGARSFNQSWGMSVYGQMEQASRIPSVLKAYDMGARYIFFWTTDKEHHLPYDQQLSIARALKNHAAQHPRPPIAGLLLKAKTAILLPYGYVLGSVNSLGLWGEENLSLDNVNAFGVTHRAVLKAAVQASIVEMRAGREFDFAIDCPDFNPAGYETVLRVNPDATVEEIATKASLKAY